MFVYSLKRVIRKQRQNPVISLLNIFGIAIGLTASLIILSFTLHEMSFDKHLPGHKKMFRVLSSLNNKDIQARPFYCLAQGMSQEISDVSGLTSFMQTGKGVMKIRNRIITSDRITAVDSNFIDFFSIKMMFGNPDALKHPFTVCISKSAAQKWFPNNNPIGKVIHLKSIETSPLEDIGKYTVQGIFADMPYNSQIQYDFLFSQKGAFEQLLQRAMERKVFGNYIYVKLNNIALKNKVEEQIPALAERYLKGKHGPPLEAWQFKLQSITDVHFSSGIANELCQTRNKSQIYILAGISLLILIIACINFINLYTSNAIQRCKQIGIQKAMGESVKSLIKKIYLETGLIFLSGLFIATGLIIMVLPLFNKLFNTQLEEFIFSWHSLILTILVFIGLVILSGGYVTNVILRINPVRSLQNQISAKLSISGAGNYFLCFQFIAAIVLVSTVVVFLKQFHYINTKSPGYDYNNTMILGLPNRSISKNVLREEFEKIKGVEKVAGVMHHAGYRYQGTAVNIGDYSADMQFMMADNEIFDVLGIHNIRTFSGKPVHKLKEGFVINSTMYNNLRQEMSDDEIIAYEPFIKGVMPDFHYNSFYQGISNFAINIRNPQDHARFLFLKLYSDNYFSVLSEIKSLWKKFYPDNPIHYSFLDEELHNKYLTDKRLSQIITSFAVLAMIVTCFGLLGMSLLNLQKRTREIGIRKVNGAQLKDVLLTLNAGYARQIMVSFIIACPVAWFAMRNWLDNFAYRTTLSWWIFILAGITVFIFALAVVNIVSMSAARRKPVEALRYE
jgi:putative ABC transport system permease protein